MEKEQIITEKVAKDSGKDWLLRFVKGMFIGSGFILPGVSGGALAAVFGMYERLISF
ncbi:membrane protein [Enterococcus sp. DIV1089c]